MESKPPPMGTPESDRLTPMVPVTQPFPSLTLGSQNLLGGVDISSFLPGPSGTESTPTTVEDDTLIAKFYRNEITYDQFMQMAGGQTIEDEMRGADEIDVEDDAGQPGPSTSNQNVGHAAYGTDLPFFVRNLVREVISDENDPSQSVPAPVAPPPGAAEPEDEPQIPSAQSAFTPTGATAERVAPRKIQKTMDALLGQANVEYARGNVKEALDLLLEVIRTDPKNAAAYQQVSDMYTECGDKQKSLQYGLLAAHLNPRTPADMWVRWGDLSTQLGLMEEAAACFGRAIKLDVGNFTYYQKRIEALDALGYRPLAMKMRLQAMQEINNKDKRVTFQWFQENIRQVASYYIQVNDEDKAISCLDIFITRSREFGEDAHTQHETLLGMLLAKGRYLEASRSILALVDGIKVVEGDGPRKGEQALEIYFLGGIYFVRPYPPPDGVEMIVEDKFPSTMLSRLVVCFLSIGRRDLAMPLKDALLRRDFSSDASLESYLLEIARAFYNGQSYKSCKIFLEAICERGKLSENAELWFIYGNTLSALSDPDGATEAFKNCLNIYPEHVDARINLSGLQQKAGKSEEALATLQGFDLDTCTHLPDERLLLRQADVLFEEKKVEQFVRCARMLLTPHFYEIHKNPEVFQKRRSNKGQPGLQLSNTLRTSAMNVIQNTNWEKFVRRLGSVAVSEGRTTNDMDATMLHDYCLKLIECLMKMERFHDALVVCCYAFLQPKITKTDKSVTFRNLIYYCATKAGSWALAFEFVRWFHAMVQNGEREASEQLHKRIFNAMNYVFCHSQNVCYHRYIMRALTKAPGNNALQAISGNNSLITGTYRHALGEYLRVWNLNKNNPLICLLLALTFTHMACKKDLSSRHMIALRGIAFMKKYEKMRFCQQEVYYNIGRMFHQMSIIPLATHFYEKVLKADPPVVTYVDQDGNECQYPTERYDLRPFAAHNLALIYKTSGNDFLARQIYEKYLVV